MIGTDETFSDHYLPRTRSQRVGDRNLRTPLGDEWPARVPDARTSLRVYLDYSGCSGFVDARAGDRGADASQLTEV